MVSFIGERLFIRSRHEPMCVRFVCAKPHLAYWNCCSISAWSRLQPLLRKMALRFQKMRRAQNLQRKIIPVDRTASVSTLSPGWLPTQSTRSWLDIILPMTLFISLECSSTSAVPTDVAIRDVIRRRILSDRKGYFCWVSCIVYRANISALSSARCLPLATVWWKWSIFSTLSLVSASIRVSSSHPSVSLIRLSSWRMSYIIYLNDSLRSKTKFTHWSRRSWSQRHELRSQFQLPAHDRGPRHQLHF